MHNEEPNWSQKYNLLKSTLEIIFVTTGIPIFVVLLLIFSVEDFVLFNFMEPYILEWWRGLFQ